MNKTDKNLSQWNLEGGVGGTSNFGHAKSAIKNFHHISNFSFWGGGGGMSIFGHVKSAIKILHQISNFSIWRGGGDIELWSCQICHKKFFTRFPIFHSGGGGGGGCQTLVMPNLPLKSFTRFPIFHLGGREGVHQPEPKCHLDLKLEKF